MVIVLFLFFGFEWVLVCARVVPVLITEFQRKFQEHHVLDAMGIIYPQYWLQDEAERSFPKHLKILWIFYCDAKVANSGKNKSVIGPLLDK